MQFVDDQAFEVDPEDEGDYERDYEGDYEGDYEDESDPPETPGGSDAQLQDPGDLPNTPNGSDTSDMSDLDVEAMFTELLQSVPEDKPDDLFAVHFDDDGLPPSPLHFDGENYDRVQFSPISSHLEPLNEQKLDELWPCVKTEPQPTHKTQVVSSSVAPNVPPNDLVGFQVKYINGWPFIKKNPTCSTVKGPQDTMFSIADKVKASYEHLVFVKWLELQRNGRSVAHYYGFMTPEWLQKTIKASQRAVRCCLSSQIGAKRVSNKNCTFLELVRENEPCKLHFDIDMVSSTAPTAVQKAQVVADMQRLLFATLSAVGLAPHCVDLLYLQADLLILDGSRQKSNGEWKLSLHLIYSTIFVSDNHTTMKALYQAMAITASKTNILWNSASCEVGFDDKIATKNRVFRLPYCVTPGVLESKLIPSVVVGSALAPLPLDSVTMSDYWLTVDTLEVLLTEESVMLHVSDFECFFKHPDNISTKLYTLVTNNVEVDSLNTVERFLTQTEWDMAYNTFNLFLQQRQRKAWVPLSCRLPPQADMRQLNARPCIVYLTVPLDKFCEHKGREHKGDNGTQTGYGLDLSTLVVWQTCFSCCPLMSNARQSGRVYSVLSLHNNVFIPSTLEHDLLNAVVRNEYNTAALFLAEHKGLLYVTPGKRNHTLWCWSEEQALWVNDSSAFIWKLLPTWIYRKKFFVERFLLAEGEDQEDAEKKINTWIARFHTADGIKAVKQIICNLAEDRTFEAKLNSHHHLIPTGNKLVFDVRTGTTRERRIDDFFSMAMKFELLENAVNIDTEERQGHTRFVDVQFLNNEVLEVMEHIDELGCNDPEWSYYMWNLLGYFMTGYTQDRSWVMMQGVGANGKSGLFAALSTVMGPFYSTVSQDFFTISGTKQAAENASPMMRSLQWIRCMVVAETTTGCKLNMARLKSLTGPDEQKCRGLYQDATTFTPNVKIAIVSNFALEIDCSDQAVTDRHMAINFAQRYVKSNPGPNEKLADTVKAARLGSSLLNAFGTWLCYGAHVMYLETKSCAHGIPRPGCIQTFLAKQLEEADLISAFVFQETEKSVHSTYACVDLWTNFIYWAKIRRSELQDIVLDAFIKQIQSKSFQHIQLKKKADGSSCFVGIRKRQNFRESSVHVPQENSASDEEDVYD